MVTLCRDREVQSPEMEFTNSKQLTSPEFPPKFGNQSGG